MVSVIIRLNALFISNIFDDISTYLRILLYFRNKYIVMNENDPKGVINSTSFVIN